MLGKKTYVQNQRYLVGFSMKRKIAITYTITTK